MKDNLVYCKRCKQPSCYELEASPSVKVYQCMGCGFQTLSLMKEGTNFYNEQVESLAELYKDLFYTDDEGKVWFPQTVNIAEKGMVYVNGTSILDWKWNAIKSTKVLEEEKENFKIPYTNEYYEYKMDYDTLKSYEQDSFLEALAYIGVLNNVEE